MPISVLGPPVGLLVPCLIFGTREGVFVPQPAKETGGYQAGVYWYSNKRPTDQMCRAEHEL